MVARSNRVAPTLMMHLRDL